jgi:hypothetical protein
MLLILIITSTLFMMSCSSNKSAVSFNEIEKDTVEKETVNEKLETLPNEQLNFAVLKSVLGKNMDQLTEILGDSYTEEIGFDGKPAIHFETKGVNVYLSDDNKDTRYGTVELIQVINPKIDINGTSLHTTIKEWDKYYKGHIIKSGSMLELGYDKYVAVSVENHVITYYLDQNDQILIIWLREQGKSEVW